MNKLQPASVVSKYRRVDQEADAAAGSARQCDKEHTTPAFQEVVRLTYMTQSHREAFTWVQPMQNECCKSVQQQRRSQQTTASPAKGSCACVCR